MYTSAAGPAPLRGVTLIELIVFIAIVSVGLAGLMSTYTAAVRGSADGKYAHRFRARRISTGF